MDKMEEGILLNEKAIVGKTFEFQLDDNFFKCSNGLITHGNVNVLAKCTKFAQGQFIFNVHTAGNIYTPCDRCLEDVELRIDNNNIFAAQLGDEDYDNGDVVTVNAKRPMLDIKQIAYQLVVVDMPVRRVHQPGVCDEVMMNALDIHTVTRNESTDKQQDEKQIPKEDDTNNIDPRWNELKKLFNK